MNTNRANAYSPEAKSIREAEGMTICDNCLTEHYAYENHQPGIDCPAGLTYLAFYTAAPDWRSGTWERADATDLGEIAATLTTLIPLDREDRGINLDQKILGYAREALEAGYTVYVAQDEDGYYFAKADATPEPRHA